MDKEQFVVRTDGGVRIGTSGMIDGKVKYSAEGECEWQGRTPCEARKETGLHPAGTADRENSSCGCK